MLSKYGNVVQIPPCVTFVGVFFSKDPDCSEVLSRNYYLQLENIPRVQLLKFFEMFFDAKPYPPFCLTDTIHVQLPFNLANCPKLDFASLEKLVPKRMAGYLEDLKFDAIPAAPLCRFYDCQPLHYMDEKQRKLCDDSVLIAYEKALFEFLEYRLKEDVRGISFPDVCAKLTYSVVKEGNKRASKMTMQITSSFLLSIHDTAWIRDESGQYRKPSEVFVNSSSIRRSIGETGRIMKLKIKRNGRVAKFLKLQTSINCDSLLSHLKSVVPEKSVALITKLYLRLLKMAEGRDKEENRKKIQAAFAKNQLIVLAEEKEEKRFLRSDEAVWSRNVKVFNGLILARSTRQSDSQQKHPLLVASLGDYFKHKKIRHFFMSCVGVRLDKEPRWYADRYLELIKQSNSAGGRERVFPRREAKKCISIVYDALEDALAEDPMVFDEWFAKNDKQISLLATNGEFHKKVYLPNAKFEAIFGEPLAIMWLPKRKKQSDYQHFIKKLGDRVQLLSEKVTITPTFDFFHEMPPVRNLRNQMLPNLVKFTVSEFLLAKNHCEFQNGEVKDRKVVAFLKTKEVHVKNISVKYELEGRQHAVEKSHVPSYWDIDEMMFYRVSEIPNYRKEEIFLDVYDNLLKELTGSPDYQGGLCNLMFQDQQSSDVEDESSGENNESSGESDESSDDSDEPLGELNEDDGDDHISSSPCDVSTDPGAPANGRQIVGEKKCEHPKLETPSQPRPAAQSRSSLGGSTFRQPRSPLPPLEHPTEDADGGEVNFGSSSASSRQKGKRKRKSTGSHSPQSVTSSQSSSSSQPFSSSQKKPRARRQNRVATNHTKRQREESDDDTPPDDHGQPLLSVRQPTSKRKKTRNSPSSPC